MRDEKADLLAIIAKYGITAEEARTRRGAGRPPAIGSRLAYIADARACIARDAHQSGIGDAATGAALGTDDAHALRQGAPDAAIRLEQAIARSRRPQSALRCASCVYWLPQQAGYGECRARPPISPASGDLYAFPVTSATAWCGQHKIVPVLDAGVL